MAMLGASVDDLVAGRPGFVLITGDPGIGKTRTADELAWYARHRQAHVLWGRCYEGDGAPPFWPWVQILRAAVGGLDPRRLPGLIADSGPQIAQLVPELRNHLLDLPAQPIPDSEEGRRRLFTSIGDFLERLAREQPLVVVIDDLQGADQPSVALLEFMVRSAAERDAGPILVVASCRSAALADGSRLREVLSGLAGEDGHRWVRLRGLRAPDVARFIEAHAGVVPPPELVEKLCAVSDGNPLFLNECAQMFAIERLSGRRGFTIPSTVIAVISQRLKALSGTCREVLALASTIGRDVVIEVLRRVAALEPTPLLVADALKEAVQRQVLTPADGAGACRFTHVLIRDALYGELPPERRRELHRRVGEVMEHLPHVGDALAELTHHFLEAGGSTDIGKAVGYAHRAAERALSLSAHEEAVRLCELALAALDRTGVPHDLLRCELLLTLGQAEKAAVDTETAQATFHRALGLARRLGSPDLFARAVLGTRWRLDFAGTDRRAVQLLEDALEAVGPADSVLRSELLGELAKELTFTRDLETQARARLRSQEAVAVARRVGDPRALCAALRRWFPCNPQPDNLDERLALANELAALGEAHQSIEIAVEASLMRIRCLFELGDLAGVERELERFGRWAAELRMASWQYFVPFWRSTLATFAGRFADAERLALEALGVGQQAKEPLAFQLFTLQMGYPYCLQGKLTAGFGDAMVQSLGDMSWNWGIRATAIVVASATGEERVARAEFEALAARDYSDMPDMNRLLAACVLAEFCAEFNDPRRAALLYPIILPFKARNVATFHCAMSAGSVARHLGLLAATLGRVEEATRHFEDALVHNARMGTRPHSALTQVEYARVLLGRKGPKDRRKAATLLRAAVDTADELGMRPLGEKARALQDRHGLERAGGPLTTTARAAVPTSVAPAAVVASDATGIPFIGRAREIGVLRRVLTHVLGGRGRLVLLAGEAGIGKTRTAEEIAAIARDHHARVLWGRCYEDEGAPPFWPWVQLLRAASACLDHATLETAVASSGGGLAQLVPDLRVRLPDLGEAPLSDSAEARFHLFESVSRLLELLTREAPLVCVIDDLHGADRSSLMLLEFVARELRDVPCLLVGTYRDGAALVGQLVVEALRVSGTERVTLSGFAPGEVAEFIEATTGERPAPALVTAVHQRTEGNPLFVGEYVRLLVASRGASAVAEPDAVACLPVPGSLRVMMLRRVTSLSPGCRAVLDVAAVIGREFRRDLLEVAVAAAGEPAAVFTALEEAVAAGIVAEALERDGCYRFSHAVMRETLYEALPTATRQRLHRQVAEVLAQRPEAELFLSEVAHHFFRAEGESDIARAVEYSRRAGGRAMSLQAYEEAARQYRLALMGLEHIGPDGDRERCGVLIGLGVALLATDDVEASKRVLTRAAGLAQRLGLREELGRAALYFGARSPLAAGTDADTVALLSAAVAAWKDTESPAHARLLAALASAHRNHEPRERVLARIEHAVGMARRTGDRAAIAHALGAWLAASWRPENREERLVVATELTEHAEGVQDLALVWLGHWWRCRLLLEAGDRLGAEGELQLCERAADTLCREPLRERNRDMRDAWSRLADDVVETTLVDAPAARAELAALAVDRFAGVPRDESWFVSMQRLSETCALLADVPHATMLRDLLLPYEGRAVLDPADNAYLGAVAHALGLLEATLSRWDAAARCFEMAAEMHERMRARPRLALSQCEHARVLLARGGSDDRERAAALLEATRAAAQTLAMPQLSVRVEALQQALTGARTAADYANAFRREGEFWTLTYAGSTIRLAETKGLRYLAHLLAHPGREIHVVDLAALDGGGGDNDDADRHRPTVGDLGPLLDAQATAAYRRRLADLREELEEAMAAADIGQATRARHEIEAITEELSAAYGLGGRARRVGDPADRIRKAVTNQVRRVLTRIGAEHPSLGRHLENAVRTGFVCAYRPEKPVVWRLS